MSDATTGRTPEASDPAAGETQTPQRSSEGDWSPRATVLTALAVVGVVGILAVGPTAGITASQLPAALPVSRLQLPSGQIDAATRIREVPVGLAKGTRIRSVTDVRPYAVRLMGPVAAERLLALIEAPQDGDYSGWIWDYPYRYGDVETVLHPVPQVQFIREGAALGAALLLLAANVDLPYELTGRASRIAFAVLDRARSGGDCDAQLNLLALVASASDTDRYAVDLEVQNAERACPGDPTPQWLAIKSASSWPFGEPDLAELSQEDIQWVRDGEAAATDFVHKFPHDPGVLATLGDAYLTTGQWLAEAQPFSSRKAFRDADTIFGRLQGGAEVLAGQLGAARAQLSLEPSEGSSVDLATRAAETSSRPGRALQVAVSAAERAHRFDEASALAKRLAALGTSAFPDPTAVIPLVTPLSLGSERLTTLRVSLLEGGEGGEGGAVVVDEGFIPAYRRAGGLTDSAEACPDWVWRRDALLAGRAAAASQAWPAEFVPVGSPGVRDYCPDGARLKRQIDSRLSGTLPSYQEDEGDMGPEDEGDVGGEDEGDWA